MNNLNNNKKFFNVYLVTPSGNKYIFKSIFLKIKGELGDIGICYNHSPLISTISPGSLHIKTTSLKIFIMFISGGIIEIMNNNIIILADTIIEETEKMFKKNII